MEAWRAQEAVLDGVETCPPGHAPDGGAGGWCGGRRSCRALLWRVDRCSFGSGQRAAPGGGVRGHLDDGDRFGAKVRTRYGMEVV